MSTNDNTLLNLLTVNKILAVALPFMIFAPNIINKRTTSSDGENVAWRPKPIIFGIVWTILVFLIIISWFLVLSSGNSTQRNIVNVLFISVIICAVLWQTEYRKNKSNGVTVFIFLLFFLIPLIIYLLYSGFLYSALLIVPLLIWAIVAMVMNIVEVTNDMYPPKCR